MGADALRTHASPGRSARRVVDRQPGRARPARPLVNSLPRLWTAATSSHSARTWSSPRRLNRRKPRASFIWPKTGSTIVLRRA